MHEPFCDPAPAEGPDKAVTVLTVAASEEDQRLLSDILKRSKWRIHEARDCRQAVETLHTERIPVVVCDASFQGGSWKDILAEAEKSNENPLLIVTSRLADEHLWAEVLNLGGYDVLAKPFDSDEVVRIISLAWLHWKQKRHGLCALKATA